MGKFIKIVLILYVSYYAIMVLFDLFIKKAPIKNDQEDGENFQIDDFPTEQVRITEEEIAIEKDMIKKREQANKLEEENDDASKGEISEDELKILNQQLNKEEGVQYGEIEHQGINIDTLKLLAQEKTKEVMDIIEPDSGEKQNL